MKNASFLRRLGFAVAGIRAVARREKSFRTQLALGFVAASMTAVLRPGWTWAAIIGLCIALVLAQELVNAALEYMSDRLHPDIHPEWGGKGCGRWRRAAGQHRRGGDRRADGGGCAQPLIGGGHQGKFGHGHYGPQVSGKVRTGA